MEQGGKGDCAEALFHLQLAFQKLEEEVKLYRNGTTAESLLELLREKDGEIMQLKGALSETTDKLRRIAKGSSELITKCEVLQKERDAGQRAEQALAERLAGLEGDAKLEAAKMETLKCEVAGMHDELQSCRTELRERDASSEEQSVRLEKLQARCAGLVSENSERGRLIDKEKRERRENIKELSAQLEKGIRFNTELKERLRSEQAGSLALAAQLHEAAARLTAADEDQRAIRRDLEKDNAALQSRLSTLQSDHIALMHESGELRERISRLEAEARRAEAMLRAKGLRDCTNQLPPDAADVSAKPLRPVGGGR